MPAPTRHFEHWPPGVPRTLSVTDRNLFSHLENSAQTNPDKTAIDYYGRQTSFRRLHEAALALAGYMQRRLGVQRGDRVLLLMQNCPQFVIAYYAVLRCDAVVVAVNPMSTAEEVGYYAADSGGRVLVTTREMLDRVDALLERGALDGCIVGAIGEYAGTPADAPFLQIPAFVSESGGTQACAGVHGFSEAIAAGIEPMPMRAAEGGLAVVAYTSGTTGRPKGAMLSHRNFAHAIMQRATWLSERAEDSELAVLPISHLAGMNIMNLAVFLGRCLVLLARWDADAALALIERRRIGVWGAVTPMLAEVFSRGDIDRRDLSSLRRIYGGATAMPASLVAAIERRLGIPFIESYGMTECCGSSHINPPQAARHQCAGVPHINCDSRVIDPQTAAELGPGQSGEIVICSPTVFSGYWNNPQATQAAFVEIDGKRFLRSGDLGHYDESGYFYVTDRLKRMINASGLKVWPAEVESVLFGHPAVQDVCVISARDAHRGETVKALVVLRPEARGAVAPEALSEWSRERLSAYKVPRLVEFVDALPKTATGKTLWRVAQEAQNARDRAVG